MTYFTLPGMAYTITITVHVYGQMLLGLPWFTRLGMRYAEPIPTRVNPIVNTSPFLLTHVFLGNAHAKKKTRHKVLFFYWVLFYNTARRHVPFEAGPATRTWQRNLCQVRRAVKTNLEIFYRTLLWLGVIPPFSSRLHLTFDKKSAARLFMYSEQLGKLVWG